MTPFIYWLQSLSFDQRITLPLVIFYSGVWIRLCWQVLSWLLSGKQMCRVRVHLMQTLKPELGPPLPHVAHPLTGRGRGELGKQVISSVQPRRTEDWARCCERWTRHECVRRECLGWIMFISHRVAHLIQSSPIFGSWIIGPLKEKSRWSVTSIQGAFVMKWNVIAVSTSGHSNRRPTIFFRMWSLSSSLKLC